MAEELDPKELVSFEELLSANMIQVDALSQLPVKKRVIAEGEFFVKLKQVQIEFQEKAKGNVG